MTKHICGSECSVGSNLDIERLKKAIDSKTYTMPQGLSQEEMREHILKCARELDE